MRKYEYCRWRYQKILHDKCNLTILLKQFPFSFWWPVTDDDHSPPANNQYIILPPRYGAMEVKLMWVMGWQTFSLVHQISKGHMQSVRLLSLSSIICSIAHYEFIHRVEREEQSNRTAKGKDLLFRSGAKRGVTKHNFKLPSTMFSEFLFNLKPDAASEYQFNLH